MVVVAVLMMVVMILKSSTLSHVCADTRFPHRHVFPMDNVHYVVGQQNKMKVYGSADCIL